MIIIDIAFQNGRKKDTKSFLAISLTFVINNPNSVCIRNDSSCQTCTWVCWSRRGKKRRSFHLPDLITLSWTNNRSSKLHMEEFVFEIRPIQGMIVGFQRGARVFLVNMPLQTGRVALARKREQNTRPYRALGSLSRSPRVHFILESVSSETDRSYARCRIIHLL